MKQAKWIITAAVVTLLSGFMAGCTLSGTGSGSTATAATGETAAPPTWSEEEMDK